MGVRLKRVEDQVIVITGASSGIGLATAEAAAARGARVVLAARNGDALADVERRITADGGRATHVVADVSRREDVQRIADAAVERFGGFDTWVNDAGVSIFGRLEEVSDEDHRRLFEVNFWGLVYGSLIAVGHLKRRGGALINLGSVASDTVFPLQGMYCASKHAIKGFTDALRMELEMENAPVTVTLIRPAAIDTPFPHRARNYMDEEPKLPPPVYRTQEVAAAILHAAEHGDRDIYVGGGGRVLSGFARHFPETADWIGAHVLSAEQRRGEPARTREGTLYDVGHDGEVRGDHPGFVHPVSAYTRAVMNPAVTGLLAIGAGVALAALAGGAEGRRRS